MPTAAPEATKPRGHLGLLEAAAVAACIAGLVGGEHNSMPLGFKQRRRMSGAADAWISRHSL
jgi:hypothetical protein